MYGIGFLNVRGETLSSDDALVIAFINRYRIKIAEMGLMQSQIKGYPFRGFKSMGQEFNICQTKL